MLNSHPLRLWGLWESKVQLYTPQATQDETEPSAMVVKAAEFRRLPLMET
jgi:hypothetical protein